MVNHSFFTATRQELGSSALLSRQERNPLWPLGGKGEKKPTRRTKFQSSDVPPPKRYERSITEKALKKRVWKWRGGGTKKEGSFFLSGGKFSI